MSHSLPYNVQATISVLSPAWPQTTAMLVNQHEELQLYGDSLGGGGTSFNWTAANLTSAAGCMGVSGQYLVVHVGCLVSGRAYRFVLTVDSGGPSLTTQVSEWAADA